MKQMALNTGILHTNLFGM